MNRGHDKSLTQPEYKFPNPPLKPAQSSWLDSHSRLDDPLQQSHEVCSIDTQIMLGIGKSLQIHGASAASVWQPVLGPNTENLCGFQDKSGFCST